jgi:hypothetical protein
MANFCKIKSTRGLFYAIKGLRKFVVAHTESQARSAENPKIENSPAFLRSQPRNDSLLNQTRAALP